MKTLFFSILAVFSISTSALAADEISVVVNGRSYTCGEGGGAQFKYFCRCDGSELNYYRANRASGDVEKIKSIYYYGSPEQCASAMSKYGLCH